MSEFNEQDNIIEEETPVLHLELEDEHPVKRILIVNIHIINIFFI